MGGGGGAGGPLIGGGGGGGGGPTLCISSSKTSDMATRPTRPVTVAAVRQEVEALFPDGNES